MTFMPAFHSFIYAHKSYLIKCFNSYTLKTITQDKKYKNKKLGSVAKKKKTKSVLLKLSLLNVRQN